MQLLRIETPACRLNWDSGVSFSFFLSLTVRRQRSGKEAGDEGAAQSEKLPNASFNGTVGKIMFAVRLKFFTRERRHRRPLLNWLSLKEPRGNAALAGRY